jgi:hypothetical protein
VSQAQRMQALLELIEAERARACAAIVGQAEAEAAALRAKAHADARRLVAQAFADERVRVRAALDAAQARLQTQRRLHAQRRLEALLALAWQRLPAALRARWTDPSARRCWIAQAQAQARAAFGAAAAWTVQHGSDGLAADPAAWPGPVPRFETDARIAAGLRIVAGANVIDATLDGLLADRDEIGGRLVARLNAAGAGA